jgi:hypothetical protein
MLNRQLLKRAQAKSRLVSRDKCVENREENRKNSNHKRRSQEIEKSFLDKYILLVPLHLVLVLLFLLRELSSDALSVEIVRLAS